MVDVLKRLYEVKTVYRLVWTTAQLAAGLLVVGLGADPKVGLLVTLLATAVTSIARENLAAKKA